MAQQLLDQSAINQSWECLDGHWMSGQDDHKSHLKKMSQRLSPKKTRHRGYLERKASKLVAHPASSMLDYRHFQGPRHNGRFYMLRPPEMGPWGEGLPDLLQCYIWVSQNDYINVGGEFPILNLLFRGQ